MSMKRIMEVIEEQREHCVIEGEPNDVESLLILGYAVSHIAHEISRAKKNKLSTKHTSLEEIEKEIAVIEKKWEGNHDGPSANSDCPGLDGIDDCWCYNKPMKRLVFMLRNSIEREKILAESLNNMPKEITAQSEKLKIFYEEIVLMGNCIKISGRVGADWKQVTEQLSVVIKRTLNRVAEVDEKK